MALVALNPGAAGERAQGGCCCADAFAGSDTKVHKGRVPQGNRRCPRHLPWDKSPLFSHLVPVNLAGAALRHVALPPASRLSQPPVRMS